MAKKSRKTDRQADAEEPRVVQEVAGLVYAAYGFSPALLTTVPADSPVRTTSQEAARAELVRLGMLTERELQTLSLEQATHWAVERLTYRFSEPGTAATNEPPNRH